MARSECNYFKPDESCREGETGIELFSQYEPIKEKSLDNLHTVEDYIERLPRE